MRTPSEPDKDSTQEEDDEKEGKAYDELVESLFFQPSDSDEE